jgi:NAD(P)-dependent dehydrogenase (short-subunit alcohol dehydrogenase family)
VVADRDEASLAKLKRRYVGHVHPVVADAASWDGNGAAVGEAVAAHGRLDVFVSAVGIFDGALPTEEIPGESLGPAFDELFAANVKSPLLGVRAALDELTNACGSVILTTSFAGSEAGGGGALYTASKHAVAGLVRQLAHELAPEVRVNGVAPGVIHTSIGGVPALGQERMDAVLSGTERLLPLGHIPEPEDYAGLYVLLGSDEARAVTGAIFSADSGLAVRGLAAGAGGRSIAVEVADV